MRAKHLKITIFTFLSLILFGLSAGFVSADNVLKESDQARQIFLKSLEMFLDAKSIPTYQGVRNVTIFPQDGNRREFKIRDGYSAKFGGYNARMENPIIGPNGNMQKPGNPGGSNPRGPGQGGPPSGRPGQGGQGGPPPGAGPGMGGPGMGGQNERMGEKENPMIPLMKLIEFSRPERESIFQEQADAAKSLLNNSDHLSIKGPIESTVASRKAWMIEVSPKNYTGGRIRVWIDREKKVQIKKERIDSNGKLAYSTEYEKIEFVSDDKYEFKDMPKERPGMQDMMDPGGRGQREVPPYFMEPDNRQVAPVMSSVTGFEFVRARRMPHPILKGVHFIFSDGLNSLSVFYFDTSSLPKDKNIDAFAQKLGEQLDTALPYPVLMKKDADGFILVTGDIQKEDLKKISAAIAIKNAQQIKNLKDLHKQQKPPQ